MENSFFTVDDQNVQHPILIVKDKKKTRNILFIFFVFLFIFYNIFLSAPNSFVPGTIVRIEKGSSLHSISLVLKNSNIIKSRVAFESFVIVLGKEFHTISADYLFENKVPVWQIAMRIGNGEHHMPPVSVTIPEGYNINEIADAFVLKLTNFSKTKFLIKASELEGYLFPDTYFFLTNANEGDVIKSMNENFYKKTASIFSEVAIFNKNKNDIIIMASIVEKEAKGDADRAFISGILWRRIAVGMPLQVDCAPETYKIKGLTKNPISNPGLEAIKASIYPKNSSYLYYLHDKNGTIHYAKTFAEHNKNIQKYLK